MFRLLLILIIFNVASSFILAQNAREEFGKNKIQYNDDQQDWWIYETSNIIYYWYGKSRKVAEFYVSIGENENKKIREIFEFHLRDKIELVIYSDLSDLYQTNLDLDVYLTPNNWKEEPKIVDQKMLIYFDGNHQNALKLIRKGLIRIYFNSIFSGSQIEEVVQKVISYKLPVWFESGLIEYLSESWTEEDINNLSFYWKKSGKNNFNRIQRNNSLLAGKSMWNYIVKQYGQQAISNWLYMIRIQKDLNSAARLVFQRNLRSLYDEWSEYYEREVNQFNISELKSQKLKLKLEENIIEAEYRDELEGFLLSTNQNGRKRIRFFNPQKKINKVIFKSGHRNKITIPESGYPLVFFIPGIQQYYIVDLVRNRNKIFVYDKDFRFKSSNIFPEDIQEIYDIEGVDEKKIYFTGNTNGLSDLFAYDLISRSYTRITDDIFDDQKFKRLRSDSIIMNTARGNIDIPVKVLDSIVPIFPFELYSIKDKNIQKSDDLQKIGSIEDFAIRGDEKLLQALNNSKRQYLYQRKSVLYDVSEPYLQKLAFGNENQIIKFYKKPNQKYYFNIVDDNQYKDKYITNEFIDQQQSNHIDSIQSKLNVSKGYFESSFGDPVNVDAVLQEFIKKSTSYQLSDLKFTEQKYQHTNSAVIFNPNQAIAYRNRFSMDDWSTTLNNDLLFGGLNTFTGNNPIYDVPHTGILFKTKVIENFNNYTIDFGVRIPTDFRGSEAFAVFHNNKFRWDHSFGIYRKSIRKIIPVRLSSEFQQVDKTFLLNHQMRYALDHYRSIRLNSTIRNDYIFLKATERSLLDTNGTHFQSIGSRVEYVFDDALNLSVNLRQGTQSKFFFEFSKRFIGNFSNGINIKQLPGFLFIAGMDIRHHIPIMKLSTFSNRFYLNSSFGTQRLLNHLGGTENWMLFRKFNYESPPDLASNYSYSQQVTEVRGHPISSRKGSSAMVISSEIRIPFFQYILSQNWKNSFIRNMQFIPFLDIGLSWQGALPDFNKIEKYSFYAENPAVKVNIIYNRNPFIAGTGIGLRTSLFGYFIRFDYGWPIQELKLRTPISHISIGFDF
ncbi:MAG: hypothetical protein HOP11_07765 [Saprospiraceae bacterium]|nr:hypothetical protein [Saprospiraceae bacterium]